MGRLNFRELSSKRFKDRRNIVISEAYNSETNKVGYSVAEQLVTEEDGKETKVFLKGSLGILNEDGLIALLDCVLEACEAVGLVEHGEEREYEAETCPCECCEENK